MAMPNFLMIGAARCGTDSLCNYLGQHPDVYMSPSKEPKYFIARGHPMIPYHGPGDLEALRGRDRWVSTRASYESLFAAATSEKVRGEGSVWYLYHELAPWRIRDELPDAKLIVVLRHPADRAYSAFTMLLRDGREQTLDFAEALAAEDDRVRAGWEPIWHYRRMGFYCSQLARYYDRFAADQIHIVLYDDFSAHPAETMRDLYRFLGVDDTFEPDTSVHYNASKVPRHFGVYRLVAGQSPLKSAAKALLPLELRHNVKAGLMERELIAPRPFPPEVRRQLLEVFRSDMLDLQDLIRRDLSRWLA